MKEAGMQIKILLVGVLSLTAIVLAISEKSTPLSGFTFQIKRLQEKTFLKLKTNPKQKLKYYLYILDQRLAELKDVANSESSSFVLTSSLRYSTTVGDITNFVKEKNLTDQIPNVLSLFNSHQKTILNLVEVFPKEYSEDWKYIQDDANYLKIYSDILSEYR